jgi:transglutaminase-like putative cysteine protease
VTRTASEAYQEGRGVCRDYAHLAVAFCRALNIPARYCTGYLGDVGTPPPFSPGDFAAWFEAYLGGQWYTFDARNNAPRIGRVKARQSQTPKSKSGSRSLHSPASYSYRPIAERVSQQAAR